MTHECLVSSSYGGLKSLSFKIQQYRARYGANVTDHCRQQKALTLRLTCFQMSLFVRNFIIRINNTNYTQRLFKTNCSVIFNSFDV